MRYLTLAMLLIATGCAAQPASVAPVEQSYAPSPAAALAFDPPVLAGSPRAHLARADRAPAAFAGFETTTTSISCIQSNDCFSDDNGTNNPAHSRDDYQRSSVSEFTAVIQH